MGDGDRSLADDLRKAATFGATARGGVSRFAWTDELAAVTEWIADSLTGLGLDVELDAAGNLFGRWPAPSGTAVLAASHLDTVPDGGAFDGALGVLGAVHAVRLLRDAGFQPRRPVWVGAFMDEEGTRFGTALFGSRAFVGHSVRDALAAADTSGTTVRAAMAERGFDPDRIADACRVDDLAAYLELHVEQGPLLHDAGERLGLVESIAGVLGFSVTVDGRPNHAGTTPAERRRDALVGAARMVLAVREHAATRADMRATVGRISVFPGATTVIPGRCTFSVDLRVARPDQFERVQQWLADAVRCIASDEDLVATVDPLYRLPPALMDDRVTAALRAASRDVGVEPMPMWSGAGHDAMVIAPHVPSGMLFVPSRDGVSHAPGEWTDPSDCERGARVLAGAIRRLAG